MLGTLPKHPSLCPWPCPPPCSRGAAHLCLQHPQVEDVEVAGEGGGKGHEGAQGWRGRLLLGHRQDQGFSVQVHGGDVAQQRGEADRADVLRLPKSTRVSMGQGSGRAQARPVGPPAPCSPSSSTRRTGTCQHKAPRAAPAPAGPHPSAQAGRAAAGRAARTEPGQRSLRLRGLATLVASG